MSLIGTALGIIADVITDTAKKNLTKKKIDNLKLSAEELDKEYDESMKEDYMNTAPAKKIVEDLSKAKSAQEASERSFFNYQAITPESSVAKAAKGNLEYNEAIKKIVALGIKKKEKEQEEYLRKKQNLENKIATAENSNNSSSGIKINLDFSKNQKFK